MAILACQYHRLPFWGRCAPPSLSCTGCTLPTSTLVGRIYCSSSQSCRLGQPTTHLLGRSQRGHTSDGRRPSLQAKPPGAVRTRHQGIVSCAGLLPLPKRDNRLRPTRLTGGGPHPQTNNSWDNLYKRELVNNASDPTDRGTVWFDDSDAESKLLRFLEGLAGEEGEGDEEETPAATNTNTTGAAALALDRRTTSFLDLGCGNGSLLFALREEGWRGRCLGVDYSPESVALARQIASSGAVAGDEEVEFAEWDVLRGDYAAVLGHPGEADGKAQAGWDVVHDKGTFDAISLSDEADARGRRVSEGYKARVVRLVRPGGLFLVTSCNWTEAELEGWFGEGSAAVEDGGSFVRVGRVEYPSFSFGGVKGQTISTLCFQRR